MTTITKTKFTTAKDINNHFQELLKDEVITPELFFEWIYWGHYETLAKQLLVDKYTTHWRQAVNKKYYLERLTKEYVFLAQQLETNSSRFANDFNLTTLQAMSEFLQHRLRYTV